MARAEVVAVVDELMRGVIPESSVHLYGSSFTGFGLKDSQVNMDLHIPDGYPPHRGLIVANETVISDPRFREVSHDFGSKIPMVTFTLAGLRCELSLGNRMPRQTSALLRDYFSLDPRVATLSAAVRLWARLCKLDRQAEGTLPAHAFAVMLVFFLQQQTKPVLPVIHDFLPNRTVEEYECEFTR